MKWSFVPDSDKFIDGVISAVAEKEGDAYNPVYIHGSSYDLGALIHRFENEYLKRSHDASICRISGNDFYNRYITAVKGGEAQDAVMPAPLCDMLIFENIDAIAGNAGLMQLFCRLFDRVYASGGKIIIGGLRLPQSIPALAGRVRTRLDCGIVCDLAG